MSQLDYITLRGLREMFPKYNSINVVNHKFIMNENNEGCTYINDYNIELLKDIHNTREEIENFLKINGFEKVNNSEFQFNDISIYIYHYGYYIDGDEYNSIGVINYVKQKLNTEQMNKPTTNIFLF